MFGSTRQEQIEIKLSLKHQQAMKHKTALAVLLGSQPHATWFSDTLKVNYAFSAAYFDDCEAKLTAVEELLDDPGIIKSVRLDELIHGRSLLASVVAKLDSIIRKVGGKTLS